MKVYNTLTRRKEDFVPLQAGKVGFYICGPTVYNDIHIGNARTFLSFDVIRRYLEYSGFDVTYVQNLTDVDDKIINRANEEGRTAAEVAAQYSQAFIEIMQVLGVEEPSVRPRATEEIAAMIALIERLIDSEHAYVVEGDVYFAVRSFPRYGCLSGRNIDELKAGARVEVGEKKRDPLDFALWKAAKPGEPSWDSPWGQGRPGWHIECSAMSGRYLGSPFDIHAGGEDLIFPHHENEIAQSEACAPGGFARYWLHGGMLTIDKEKMSKSEGNFLLLKDVLEYVRPQALRLLMLQTHYRSPFDYSPERLDEATAALERIEGALGHVRWELEASQDEPVIQAPLEVVENARRHFTEYMDDDFNTAGAVAVVFELISTINQILAQPNRDAAGRASLLQLSSTATELLAVLGIGIHKSHNLEEDISREEAQALVALAGQLAVYQGADAAEALQALVAARTDARAAKNWALADAIRDGLAVSGLAIEDTPQGTRVMHE